MFEPENASAPSLLPPNRKKRRRAAKASKITATRRRGTAKKRKNPKKHGSTKPSVVVPKRHGVKDPELKCQSDWRRMNFNRLACPVSSATPDSKCFKSCSTGELDISHIREHLKNFHTCDCDCQQTDPAKPCPNPMHLPNKTLTKLKTISKQHHESSGQAWRRIYQELYPGRKVPVPYLPSFDQAEAVARDPSEGIKVELTRVLEESDNKTIKSFSAKFTTEQCLCLLLVVLGAIRATGATPAALPLEE